MCQNLCAVFLFLTFCFLAQIRQTVVAKDVIYDLNAYYYEASPDGVKKQVLGVNGQFPGPTIRASLNDTLIIRVTNSIQDKEGGRYPTSVHWHGIEMFYTPWYDGPEQVAQCPIPYGQSMEYRFKLYQAGTYWYHSHHAWQYVEGFWGLLIIDNAPEVYAYDHELSISLMDWYHTPAKILGEMYHKRQMTTPTPDTGLINGRGTYPCAMAIRNGSQCDVSKQGPALMVVNPGRTYRVRVINTSARANFNFSIDGHKLTVIEVDGVDTVPVGPVDSVEIWPAQRYSFLVTMNGALSSYWIRADMSVIADGVAQPKAILRYNRAGCAPPPNPRTTSISSSGSTKSIIVLTGGVSQGRPERYEFDWEQHMADFYANNGNATIMAARNFDFEIDTRIIRSPPPPVNVTRGEIADLKHRQALMNIPLPTTTQTVNPVFLDQNLCRPRRSRGVASAPEHYDEMIVVNATFDATNPNLLEAKMNGEVYGVFSPPILYRMLRNLPFDRRSVPLRTPFLRRVIQLVINNLNTGPHPWHLHGHTFWVMGTGKEGDGAYDEKRDEWKLNARGVRRDTTPTPPNSWVVLRYETDNPGAWLLHCHINWHLEIGLGAVLIEGDAEVRTLQVPNEVKRVCALNNIY